MKIAFYTLGCKVNQYETQALEQMFSARGHVLVPFEEQADAYIINTCTVTAVSDKKSRNVIRRVRKANPDAVIAVCGCYPQTHPDDMAAGGLEGRTRSMLKVEDGCVNFCTYCIIPFARGPVRSQPLCEAVAQTKQLAAQGYRELVITGIEISSWGRDFRDGSSLIDLLEAVCAAAPECRIRLGSLEPRTITEEFCVRAAKLPNLCPHFHLSMQSGCDTVLKRMNRKYDTDRFYESVALLNKHFRRPGITTDMIVGFPGETEEEFLQSLAFIEKCAFSAMHIFPYSKRPGTPAAAMKDQILNAEKEERAHRAGAVAAQLSKSYLEQFVGDEEEVLFEEEKNGLWRGYTTRYVEVTAPSDEPLHNQFRKVRITAAQEGKLLGELI